VKKPVNDPCGRPSCTRSSWLHRALVAPARRAFTIVEIIVVLTIISILIVLAVPALMSMISTQEESLAEIRLRVGINIARDAALAGGPGEDTAAVFTYDPQGPVRIVPVVRAGTFIDSPGTSPQQFELFVPIDTVEPVTLPSGWTIRAWAPQSAFGGSWYGGDTEEANVRYPDDQANWVFPESGFYNHTRADDGENRQTFMVRFQGGSGQLVGETTKPVLVLLPRPSNVRRDGIDRSLWPNRQSDFRRYAQRLLKDPGVSASDRSTLIGPLSSDVVLTRAVQLLALTDEQALADGLGVRRDRFSGSLYQVPENQLLPDIVLSPQFVSGMGTTGATRVNRWIEGYRDLLPGGGEQDPPADLERTGLKLFTFDRYGGSLVRVQQTLPTGTPPIQ